MNMHKIPMNDMPNKRRFVPGSARIAPVAEPVHHLLDVVPGG